MGGGVQLVGSGSEMILDVAAGVDWSAICGIMMCVQQVRPQPRVVLLRVLPFTVLFGCKRHPLANRKGT